VTGVLIAGGEPGVDVPGVPDEQAFSVNLGTITGTAADASCRSLGFYHCLDIQDTL